MQSNLTILHPQKFDNTPSIPLGHLSLAGLYNGEDFRSSDSFRGPSLWPLHQEIHVVSRSYQLITLTKLLSLYKTVIYNSLYYTEDAQVANPWFPATDAHCGRYGIPFWKKKMIGLERRWFHQHRSEVVVCRKSWKVIWLVRRNGWENISVMDVQDVRKGHD